MSLKAPESEPPIYEDLDELAAMAASEAEKETVEQWRQEVDAARSAALGKRALLPEINVDHMGNVMTSRDVAEIRREGTDKDRTR